MEDELTQALSKVLLTDEIDEIDGLDEDLVAYMAGLLSEETDEEDPFEAIVPFLESVSCPDDIVEQAKLAVNNCFNKEEEPEETISSTSKLLQGRVTMSEALTEEDTAAWSMNENAVKPMANNMLQAHIENAPSARDQRKARRKLEKQEHGQDHGDEEDVGLVTMRRAESAVTKDRSKDILVRNASVSLDNGTVLLESSNLQLAYGRRYGLIGENGVGKSTLLRHMARHGLDGAIPAHLRVLHVRQEVPMHMDMEQSVVDAVLGADQERMQLLQDEKDLLDQLEQDGDTGSTSIQERRQQLAAALPSEGGDGDDTQDILKQLDQVYAQLESLKSDSAPARASMILSGLQFTPTMQQGPLSALSGGWKMRVALAAALFIEPDVLLLDEPTNHLDLQAVIFLETYLSTQYPHTLLVVSHDRGFLNSVCTDTILFRKKSLTYYRGNYDVFCRLRTEQTRNSMRVYEAYQTKRQHLMEFIVAFRANAKRASMVQSRIKTVEKMDQEAPPPPEVESVWRFHIPHSEPLGPPILAINSVTFDYNPQSKSRSEYLLQEVNFGVTLTSRIAILGANGQGKTTLLNLIMGKLKPIGGSVSIHPSLRIGHFTQHSADNFDLTVSAVENMKQHFPGSPEDALRSHLGRFQIQGETALQPMSSLSGGQKSRVAFGVLAFRRPHVLIVDEASNHLSMPAVDALIQAMQDFQGGLVVVSHDQYLVSQTCQELWVVENGAAKRFRGDFDEYKKQTVVATKAKVEESVKRVAMVK